MSNPAAAESVCANQWRRAGFPSSQLLWIVLSLGGVVVGVAGCGGNNNGGAAPPATTQMSPGVASMPASPFPGSAGTAPTTVFVGPPPYTNPPQAPVRPQPVPVNRRALLERRAAEFELVDPRRDPRRYLAMSVSDCRDAADEQEIRETGTARGGGFLNEPRRAASRCSITGLESSMSTSSDTCATRPRWGSASQVTHRKDRAGSVNGYSKVAIGTSDRAMGDSVAGVTRRILSGDIVGTRSDVDIMLVDLASISETAFPFVERGKAPRRSHTKLMSLSRSYTEEAVLDRRAAVMCSKGASRFLVRLIPAPNSRGPK